MVLNCYSFSFLFFKKLIFLKTSMAWLIFFFSKTEIVTSESRDRDQKDHGLKSAQTNSS
jgi:hypothetical protein